MSEFVRIGAILYPKPGKIERALELLSTLTDDVRANEPGTLTYQSYTTEGEGVEPMIIFLERYSDKAAFETHKQNPKLAETFKTMDTEGLVAAAPKVFHMHEVLGWLSR